MDFYEISVSKSNSNNRTYDYLVSPDYNLLRSKDVIVKSGRLYGFWYNDRWCLDEYDLYAMIDRDVFLKVQELKQKYPEKIIVATYLNSAKSKALKELRTLIRDMKHSSIELDTKVLFSNHDIVREDYATFKLPYTPKPGSTQNFDKMFMKLYSEDELNKILWVIGAVATGEIKNIQKMLYLFGERRTGKGTIVSLIKDLFQGYTGDINLGAFISADSHASTQLRNIPILIDEDSNVSKGKNVENLMKAVSHESVVVNPKGRDMYTVKFEGIIITSSNSIIVMPNVDHGMVRRPLIVKPTGERHSLVNYEMFKSGMKFEHASIVYRAIEIFNKFGRGYYDQDEENTEMLSETDIIHSFVEDHYDILKKDISLKQAGELYKAYLEDYGMNVTGYKRELKRGLSRYYMMVHKAKKVDGQSIYNWYEGFIHSKVSPELRDQDITIEEELREDIGSGNPFKFKDSGFSNRREEYPAQLANEEGLPTLKWDNVITKLKDIDEHELHYVRIPENHIVIDFDLKDEYGNKSLERCLELYKTFPESYAELSKSGQGIHLHYIYEGDPKKLSGIYSDGVEIKVFTGKAALRRKFTYSNGITTINAISSGLPLKGEDHVTLSNVDFILNEKLLRTMVKRNILKEYHSATKPSVDYIAHLFEEAHKQKLIFDLSDMKQDILTFALSSTHNSNYCLKVVNGIQYSSEQTKTPEEVFKELGGRNDIIPEDQLCFFDIEVFKNITILGYKNRRTGKREAIINPSPSFIEAFLRENLVGFNCREYDNHIMYGWLIGKTNLELYSTSQTIINSKDSRAGKQYVAKSFSYADIFDYASKKQGLKKWEIELDILHDEFEHPWDQPLPEELWERACEYCLNDVDATEAVFEATISDYKARVMLAKLSGLSVNHTNKEHAEAIIFEGDKEAQSKFKYTDLSEEFPGYAFDGYTSTYRDKKPSEGGYVYSEFGIYHNLLVLDISAMHPSSLIELKYFGPYTKNYKELKDARVDIKHGDLESAKQRFGGKLKEILEEDNIDLDALSYALKIIINSVYGLTCATFDNIFKLPDNKDNIIAKRGALFMVDLEYAVKEQGYQVAHIKTDSIKIPNADEYITNFIIDFGKKYGYDFEVEHKYEVLALVNNSTYIAKEGDRWDAVGAQYAQSFVFKTLFSREDILESDFALTKSAQSSIYLGDRFIGKTSRVYCSKSGEDLLRVDGEKRAFVNGTKGYKWRLFTEYLGKDDVDMSYYEELVIKALDNLDKLVINSNKELEWVPYIPKYYNLTKPPF